MPDWSAPSVHVNADKYGFEPIIGHLLENLSLP